MNKRTSLQEIRAKNAPKRFFGFIPMEMSFLSKYPITEFSYNAIVDMGEMIESIKSTETSVRRSISIRKAANEEVKTLKRTTGKEIGRDKETAQALDKYLNEVWSLLSVSMKMTRTKDIPEYLSIPFAIMEINSIARRVYNRISSDPALVESTELNVITMMVNVGIDSIVKNYIQALAVVTKYGKGDEAKAINEDFINTLEYLLILFNKIDGGYSLHTFNHLTSATNEVLTSWVEEIHKTEWS